MSKGKEKGSEVEARAESHVGVSKLNVHDKNGNFVRSYSAAIHGENFVAIAEEYAGKIKGEVRK